MPPELFHERRHFTSATSRKSSFPPVVLPAFRRHHSRQQSPARSRLTRGGVITAVGAVTAGAVHAKKMANDCRLAGVVFRR